MRARRWMRRLGWLCAGCALMCVAAVLLSPTGRRGYGLLLSARSMDVPAGERVTALAWVDHMPRICYRMPCDGGDPLNLSVALPRGSTMRREIDADSAWIIAGPMVYGFRLREVPASNPFWPRTWVGHQRTGLPLDWARVGVLVRFREPGKPPRVLRVYAVPVGTTW
jgi:hypothetical protein